MVAVNVGTNTSTKILISVMQSHVTQCKVITISNGMQFEGSFGVSNNQLPIVLLLVCYHQPGQLKQTEIAGYKKMIAFDAYCLK